ncbi:MAG: DEAD/DEAH box helicase family protein [Gammaproteobacteria bacterium]|nr:DEAD/DEAH box helicase family protein [Gammaproteobacteria bacterium]MDE0281283.1 DEAD/DEAH box helicase family protein [Gammaproteobacteria bacterium]
MTNLEQISSALDEIGKTSPHQTDGKWLEHLTADCAPLIAEWDVSGAWLWQEWPDRQVHYPDTPDIGIDVVAKRASDGKFIAIQSKSRKLDKHGRGADITKDEFNSFLAVSADELWAERWLVVIGDTRLGDNASKAVGRKPVTLVNIETDLRKQQETFSPDLPGRGPHFEGGGDRQTRDCMQGEVIETSVRLMRQHAKANDNGRARGRIILPCGTGKSRIALRIIEELTEPGQVSAVLCPSISLVAQLRGEFLAHCSAKLNALAVCSDEGVGRDKDLASDPTADLGHTSASEVKGLVTTKADEIGEWMDTVAAENDRIGVIFGTYQSSHRIVDAMGDSGREIQVMVADEAHRTAGLRRIPKMTDKLRDFTVCHDDGMFPAKYRIYQTATPRVYNTSGGSAKPQKSDDWVVRDMADEEVFGPELYRKSYAAAVTNDWLTDYRIIAIGVNDEDAYRTANELAAGSSRKLSTAHFLRSLVLAMVMGGALRSKGVDIRSSINFMNRITTSREMTDALGRDTVRKWVQGRLAGQTVADYRLEHLDAESKIAERENAKARLMGATQDNPHGIINVGIFGEGVDAPSLSAVGFLEARKSPVDVIQAVGRVMRRAENKEMGYIICPILIPPNTDAETWLRNSGPEDGWRELGQILLALRAHDGRIEDRLSELMQLYLPPPPMGDVATMVTIGGEDRRVQHHGHVGRPGTAESDIEKVLSGEAMAKDLFRPLNDVVPVKSTSDGSIPAAPSSGLTAERILSGKRRQDGSVEMREAGVERIKSQSISDGTPGPVDADRSKKTGRKMVNGEAGRKIDRRKRAQEREARAEERIRDLFDEVDDVGISANLLARSGLARNRAERDVNILEDSIKEAKLCLKGDELDALLDRHFGLDQLDDAKRKAQADGCTIASLLLMNAAMLHERIAAGGWLPGISGMDEIKNAPDAIDELHSQWNRITRHDFLPVIEPAIEIIEAVRKEGRRTGLNRALRHLAGEAERIAESYADLGTDHAGPLFNRVMGNQASDGAFFTRPPAAALLARLTLDAASQNADWTAEATWREHRTVDLACGSGTLLAAMLTEMKRRAEEQGADRERQGGLQKLAVEEVIAGLDFNPVSLQLAAAQMTAGNSDVVYRKMQLHRMPYGPTGSRVNVGSLELLGQSRIVPRIGQMELGDASLDSVQMKMSNDDPLLEDAVDAASNVRIVIMNPPFTNRSKMGEKFRKDAQGSMREKVDELEKGLVAVDPEMEGFADKNSIGPLFVALADKCIDPADGTLSMINPTIALTTTSGRHERVVLAKRFHIHTLLTCHQPRQINLSQNTSINESMIIARRHEGKRPPTRIISLDRFPLDEREAGELHRCISGCTIDLLPDGWGEVSEWPAERIDAGDWSAVGFRSPQLAKAAVQIANEGRLLSFVDQKAVPSAVLQGGGRELAKTDPGIPGSFPVLYSKGAEAQTRISAEPDIWFVSTKQTGSDMLLDNQEGSHAGKLHQNAGHLHVTSGQRTNTARLTAVASEVEYIGVGWMSVPGITFEQAKAAAVFLNSTAGRLQLMQNPGRALDFPVYRPGAYEEIRMPDLEDEKAVSILALCWDRTRDMDVPQFRDGECEVRRLWDEAVANALGWDPDELAALRMLLHNEPHVRGLGREQFGE